MSFYSIAFIANRTDAPGPHKNFQRQKFLEAQQTTFKALVLVTACAQPLHRYKQILPTN